MQSWEKHEKAPCPADFLRSSGHRWSCEEHIASAWAGSEAQHLPGSTELNGTIVPFTQKASAQDSLFFA